MLLYAAACDAVFLTLLLALLCTRRLIAELIVSRVSTSSASTDGSEDAWTRRPAVVAAASCVCINLLYITAWLAAKPTSGSSGTLTALLANLTLWCAVLALMTTSVWFFAALARTSDRVVAARAAREFGVFAVAIPPALLFWGYARLLWFGVAAVPLLAEAGVGVWCLRWAGSLGGPLSI